MPRTQSAVAPSLATSRPVDVDDIDAPVAQLKKAGGTLLSAPTDLAGVTWSLTLACGRERDQTQDLTDLGRATDR